MARLGSDVELTPSVLDRLIDLEPYNRAEPPSRRSVRLADLKNAVRRDLEWLLNHRQILAEIPDGSLALHNSLLTYGLPDFTHASLDNAGDQDRLRRTIEVLIARFEPRLMNVRVATVDLAEQNRSLRFRIDAMLRVDPAPEPITFDSMLELSTKSFVVQGD